MKDQKSDNIFEKSEYNLEEFNKDNGIEFDLSKIENIQELRKDSLSSKNKKMELNYSLIIKNILRNINEHRNERYYRDEFMINLLLMSSLKNIYLKLICLNIILHFNSKKDFSSLINYILTKVWRYQNRQNSNLNKKNLIYILTLSSKILYQNKNYFYSFYFLWNAKEIIQKEEDPKRYKEELEDIQFYLSQVKEMIENKMKERCNFLKSYSPENLENVNKILDSILVGSENKNNKDNDQKNFEGNNDINEENAEYGSYNFLIIHLIIILKLNLFVNN